MSRYVSKEEFNAMLATAFDKEHRQMIKDNFEVFE